MTAALQTLCGVAIALPLVVLTAFALVMHCAHQHDFQGEK